MITIASIMTIILLSILAVSIIDICSRVWRGVPVTFEDIIHHTILLTIIITLIILIG